MPTHRSRIDAWTVIALGLAVAGAVVAAAAQPPRNLIPNGGFENGNEGWSWGQWKGLPEPGYVDRDRPYAGAASYTMSLAGVMGERLLYTHAAIDSNRDFELSLALRGKDLPVDGVSVELLQWGTEKGEEVTP